MEIKNFSPESVTTDFVDVIQQLRPNLDSVRTCRAVLERAHANGTRFFVIEVDQTCAGFVSYAFGYNLYLGDFCVVDDLVVSEKSRGLGLGGKLLAAVEDECKKNKIGVIKLDSGLQRVEAHGFYEKNGFEKKCFTFEKKLT